MTITQPRLETERLILEAFQASDIEDIFAYASDEEVARFVGWSVHKTHEDSQAFLNFIAESDCADSDKLFFTFAIRLKASGRVIGSFGFFKPHKFSGQLDYALGKKYWNQGFVTEAGARICVWAIETFPDLMRIQSYCMPENIGSTRVMEKLGLKYEGTRRKVMMVKDKPVDLAYYALLRDLHWENL